MSSGLEKRIRKELGIPDDAQHVVILSMDAHMDWDWNGTFQDYFNSTTSPHYPNTVTSIMASAFQLMASSTKTPRYYYSVCEMGYLRAAVENNPALLQDFKTKIGDTLRIVGGGVTSPDNLLPHGETILRNYLAGHQWMKRALGLPLRQAYVPDDFGHDSQFPILLEALGLQGVSFSRIPGSPNQGPPATPVGGGQSLAQQLLASKADFLWQANDGSTTLAHYLQDTYSQGNGITNGDIITNIQGYLSMNQGSSPTPYVYVPCGDDFAMPIEGLLSIAQQWNQSQFQGGPNDVYAVVATLDHYLQLVSCYPDQLGSPQSFDPTPYWTGFYASRIRNKVLHQAATRALLGAETFGFIADLLQGPDAYGWQDAKQARNRAIRKGWKGLVPSTHHDYITGTAADAVYTLEQVPLLESMLALGRGARESALQQIAAQVSVQPKPGETPVAIFNQLGFTASGPVELPPIPGLTPQGVRFADGTTGAVQKTWNGNWLMLASAPSLGYQAAYLSSQAVTPSETATLTTPDNGQTWVLTNGALTATVSQSSNWGLTSLKDTTSGNELIPSGQTANDLAFYLDNGGLYRFANEYSSSEGIFEVDGAGSLSPVSAEVMEEGPLRVWLRTTVAFSSKDGSGNAISGTYVRDYVLVAGEPFLRMGFTGGAPLTANGAPSSANLGEGNQYSVMAVFPLATPGGSSQASVDTLTHGTPYHWVTPQTVAYWSAPTFLATHDQVLPQAQGQTLAALYQSTLPAWAVDANGNLISCLLRNTPWDSVHGHGANGQDTGLHSHGYALRVPSGLQDPSTGAQLMESRAFTTPLLAAYASVPLPTDTLSLPSYPETFSLASASQGALLTAAKAGTLDPFSLVLRVYQPTNGSLEATVTLASQVTAPTDVKAVLVTALEEPVQGATEPTLSGSQVTLSMSRALATLQLRDVLPRLRPEADED